MLLVGDNKADKPNFRPQRQRAENRKDEARVGRGTELCVALRFKHTRSAGDETAPRPRNACSHSHTRAQIGVCATDCRSRKAVSVNREPRASLSATGLREFLVLGCRVWAILSAGSARSVQSVQGSF